MKIIIIDHEPYTKKKRDLYFINEFLNDGAEVEFWSVCKALKYQKDVKFNHLEHGENVFYLESYEELLERIRLVGQDTIVILEIWFTWSTIKLFRLLKQRGIKTVQFDYYLNITSAFHKPETLRNIFKKLSFLEFTEKVIKSFKQRTLSFIGSKFNWSNKSLLFVTGETGLESSPYNKKKAITYFDVETYLEVKDLPRLFDQKYIVFLDIMLPSHPDVQRLKVKTIAESIYYLKLRKFFDKLEAETGYKVVIAAHPKSKYINNEFGNRDCLIGKTAHLVKDAEFIVCHESISVNFAILFNKPLLYIYTSEFVKEANFLNSIYRSMDSAANYFGSKIINIDDFEYDEITTLSIKNNSYQNFLKKYIYAPEYPISNYTIIYQSLRELN